MARMPSTAATTTALRGKSRNEIRAGDGMGFPHDDKARG